MWPELYRARDNAKKIEKEIESLIKKQSSLKKEEISRHIEALIEDVDNTSAEIEEIILEIKKNMENHRKYLISKNRFLKRHYSIKKL